MKLLAFADLHCHNYAQHSVRLANGLNSRFQDCLNILDQVGKAAKQNNVDVVVFCGDLYESRTTLPVEVLAETHKAMRNLAGIVPVYCLVGNHDLFAKAGDIYAVETLRDIENLHLVSNSCTITESGVKLSFIPHIADMDTFKAAAQAVETCELLFLHQTFREAVAGPADHSINTSLSLDDLPTGRVGAVISGDIHKRQQIPSHCFEYPGSPLQLNFGERDETKAFTLVDTQEWKFTAIPTDAPEFYWLSPDGDPFELTFQGIDLNRDFVRVSYDSKWDANAQQLKEQYPRIELDMRKTETVAEQRISEQIVAGGDKELLSAWLDTLGELDHGLDPKQALEIGIQELAEVSA